VAIACIATTISSFPELAQALHTQRTVLEQKRQLLDRTITAVTKAETALRAAALPDHALFTQIIEVIEMQNTKDWQQQYDELVQTKMASLRAMTPEARTELRGQWTALFKDVEEVLDEANRAQNTVCVGARSPLSATVATRRVRNRVNEGCRVTSVSEHIKCQRDQPRRQERATGVAIESLSLHGAGLRPRFEGPNTGKEAHSGPNRSGDQRHIERRLHGHEKQDPHEQPCPRGE
jgi:hypothetical protein